MMQLDLQSLRELYRLDNIIRYNTFPKHKQETVATHSYFVILFTMMLCDTLEVNNSVRMKAIEGAIIHDIPEIVINDITYDAKKAMPEINVILYEHEYKILRDKFPRQYYATYVHIDEKEQVIIDKLLAHLIMELADTISVLQFAIHEVEMGNQFMVKNDWISKTHERIEFIKNKIEEMGVSCQKIII